MQKLYEFTDVSGDAVLRIAERQPVYQVILRFHVQDRIIDFVMTEIEWLELCRLQYCIHFKRPDVHEPAVLETARVVTLSVAA